MTVHASLLCKAALAFGLGLAAFAAQAQQPLPAALATLGATTSPIGWVQFCRDNPEECRDNKNEPVTEIKLSKKVWEEMVRINKAVNDAVEPVTDMDHYGVQEFWTYPTDGKGDCEDYVLEKRRQLMAAGFPRSALLITVVRQKNNEGHAVLIAKTDRGDYVLDNQEEDVMLWSATSYRYIKRQAEANQNHWVLLGPGPAPATTAQR